MKSQAEAGAWLSILAYVLLSILKVWVGTSTNSQALTADGLNNTTDVITSIGVLIGLRIAKKPRDNDHPYGHSRAETVSTLIASIVMAIIGLQVLVDAAYVTFWGHRVAPNGFAGIIAILAAGFMFLIYLINSHLAKKSKSHAIHAIAKDNLSDAIVSLGAAIGIFGARLGMPWLDPLAAAVVGLIILKTAWEIFAEMSHHLTDGFEETKLAAYRITMEQTEGVQTVVDLKGRMQGDQVIVDVVIEVNAQLSVQESHQITDRLELEMQRVHQVNTTHIHVEPDSSHCSTYR
ncbi:cation diffusion facilitator family transporter [Marininema halotolerans]|uniref:Cation diffusion facilitator family transporter n=1 Tax=Marininema halotolerans TaxID=1155944 RepID=A0A1I6TPE6_9BACL|nr:cation diffusion facilitator family transporter [Marininema halotolerans]SFS90847.1 cation diffusion facilitator family transporter [Marininema halotolerans]